MILYGKKPAEDLKKGLLEEFQQLGYSPKLMIVTVGRKEESEVYRRSIQKLAGKLGIEVINRDLREDISPADFRKELSDRIYNPDGIIVERPLPDHLEVVADEIPSRLDIEGLTSRNLGVLAFSPKSCIAPPTPQAALHILDYYQMEIRSKKCLVVGRSRSVGIPLGLMLLQKGRDATVTITHSKTENLAEHTKNADVIFLCAGVPGLLTGEMVTEGSTIIDIGINIIKDNRGKQRIVGDADFDSVLGKGCNITPVPGGVGALTTPLLMKNLLNVCRRRVV